MKSEYGERLQRVMRTWESTQHLSSEDVTFLVERVNHADRKILQVIDLLSATRDTFRSKQVERARKILEELL